jgi:hypothetical protein
LQRHLALSTEYQLERAIGDSTGNNLIRVARSTTHRAATEARVFHDSGGFGALRVTFVDQAGQFQNPDQSVTPGADQFWVLDASIGYRLPRQRMGVFVELRNALNAEFSFQDSAPREPTIVPKRLVIVRVTFAL